MDETFILKQLRRNAGIYRVCLVVFKIIFACIIVAAILNAFGILSIRLAAHETIIFLTVLFQHASFSRLKTATEKAIVEIEKALATPGFNIPDDYTSETLYARSQTVHDAKSVMVQIIGFGVMGFTLAALGILLVFLDQSTFFLLFSAILIGASIPLFVYMSLYVADYRIIKTKEDDTERYND